MDNNTQIPTRIKLVSTDPIPQNLFVCSAKIIPEVGKALESLYQHGSSSPKDILSWYNEHLVYTYGLSEKGVYWEAGPSIDFTQILYIFSVDSLEQAQRIMHNDPFYKRGIFYADWWFQWAIHTPIWKSTIHTEFLERDNKKFGVTPEYPPGTTPPLREIKVDLVTPIKLYASFAKVNAEYLGKINEDARAGNPVPAFFIDHLTYRMGSGGMAPMGYEWESGPSADWQHDLSIFSVSSMEMFKLLRENDAFIRNGAFYDPTYFEWCIHLPLRKASPAHRETLKRLLKGSGVDITM